MSQFLQYSESPTTPPDGIRRDFIFLPPSGYEPVDAGNTLWLINGVQVPLADYTIVYTDTQITLTLDGSVSLPIVTDLFAVYADSALTGADSTSCPVDNFTNFKPGDFRARYPQVSNYAGITDNVLDSRIVQASVYVNETKFGVYYCEAMGYVTAHILSLEIDAGLFTTSNGISDGGLGGSISLGTGGAINSASAGSVSYSASVDNSKGGQIDEWLKATGWGQKFLTLRSMIVAPAATISNMGVSGFSLG